MPTHGLPLHQEGQGREPRSIRLLGAGRQIALCEDMRTSYRIGLDGSTIAEWNIQKSIPNGDMSGDGRLDVSPDGQKLLHRDRHE